MPTQITAGPLGEIRAASTAGTGTALTTTAAFIHIPSGTNHLFLEGRNYVTAVAAQVLLNPYLHILQTTNGLTAASTMDVSEAAQDGTTTTVITLNSYSTAANLDFVYIGSHLPFAGVSIDVQNTNSTGSVLTVKYWNGTAWTDITATDNSASGGATLAVDGTVTWAVPTDWTRTSLLGAGDTTLTLPGYTEQKYWTRWEFSVTLDSTVSLNSIVAINRSTVYMDMVAGRALDLSVTKGKDGIGCVQARTDAGTANLIVNAATAQGSRFLL